MLPPFSSSPGGQDDGFPIGFTDEIDAHHRSGPSRLAQGFGPIRIDDQQSLRVPGLEPRARDAEFTGEQPVEP